MSSTASAYIASRESGGKNTTDDQHSDVIEPNHSLPARRVIEGEENTTTTMPEDAATTAASEELRHTTISDTRVPESRNEQFSANVEVESEDKDMKETGKESTPEAETADLRDEDMRDRIASPKKKRGRDQDDDSKDLEDSPTSASGSAADGGVVNGSRTERLGPEKKRPRDTSEDYTNVGEEEIKVTSKTDSTNTSTAPVDNTETSTKSDEPKKAVFGSDTSTKKQTSPTAFASSGFASLAGSSTSGFGSLGASKPSVFGGGKPLSGFGALGSKPAEPSNKPAAALSFGGGTNSGFGGLGGGGSSVFGSKLGNGFAGGAGPKLSSFAAPAKENESVAPKPAKAVKAFGAPEESDEDKSGDGESDAAVGSGDEESIHPSTEKEKKASKAAKVHIEDGEAGEATLLQIRAKLFALESKEAGWKERGVGSLKINVPRSCVSFDENGVAIPGSFDASGLEEEEETDSNLPKVARLIMRQENTHRVVLNTIILKAMKFEDKPATNTAQIIFTAFEGSTEAKPINMLLKMNEANARLFRSEIDSIQHEL
ncbi:PH [Glarea lozoyensis ATCC 20868]|uniref:PH n=1 Tax=Glarea lozoyensis (strain ATCC 20868 / MF5171) TaxID=1116229 RepID=S3D3L1_GLAL2|nr:PH [Glarea lozoyensis ATCC 20868]EPE33072.1 PH [Glarea lozoyensis ATCC 20868]